MQNIQDALTVGEEFGFNVVDASFAEGFRVPL
jgi:hypothetical protein